jgi:hypothetical protein
MPGATTLAIRAMADYGNIIDMIMKYSVTEITIPPLENKENFRRETA